MIHLVRMNHGSTCDIGCVLWFITSVSLTRRRLFGLLPFETIQLSNEIMRPRCSKQAQMCEIWKSFYVSARNTLMLFATPNTALRRDQPTKWYLWYMSPWSRSSVHREGKGTPSPTIHTLKCLKCRLHFQLRKITKKHEIVSVWKRFE